MDNKITYKDYKSTYKEFASTNCANGPLSIDTINTIVYYMNTEFLEENDRKKVLDIDYRNYDYTTFDYISKAVEEVKTNNTSYYLEKNELTNIKLSNAVVLKKHKETIEYIEELIEKINSLPFDDARYAYIELKNIIEHKNMEEYNELSVKQQKIIESIDLPVATNLFDYRNRMDKAKQYIKIA